MTDMTLKERREFLKYSQEEMANLLGVSPLEIATWERDEASCPYGKMLELAMNAVYYEAQETRDDEFNALIAMAEAESARAEASLASSDEILKQTEAFMAEHRQWEKEQAAWYREHMPTSPRARAE